MALLRLLSRDMSAISNFVAGAISFIAGTPWAAAYNVGAAPHAPVRTARDTRRAMHAGLWQSPKLRPRGDDTRRARDPAPAAHHRARHSATASGREECPRGTANSG